MSTIGILTIGQSPRNDLSSVIKDRFHDDVRLVERGALDSIGDDKLKQLTPTDSKNVFITKLRNETTITIAEETLLPFLQNELTALEKEVDVVLMLCTGAFPTLKATKPVIYPDQLLTHVTRAILPADSKVGLIIPLAEQKEMLQEKWDEARFQLEVEVASPYEGGHFVEAGRKLKEKGVQLIVLDCMGYNEAQKRQVQQGSGLPVLVPNVLAAVIAGQYI